MSSLGGLRVRDVAVEVVVGRADQRPPVPGEGEDPALGAGGDDAGGARRGRASPGSRVMWVPRLGAIRGTSASSWISSGRMRSAQTPVALMTLSASISNSSPDSASVQSDAVGALRRARRRPVTSASVQADRAEALGLAEDRQHQADVVGLAVVEEVRARGIQRPEGRDQLDRLLPRDRAVAVGGPVVAGLLARGVAVAPRLADPRRRHHVVHVEPDPEAARAAVLAEASAPGTGVG